MEGASEACAVTSSEEDFKFECSPCENDGITKQANFFCLQCKDYLCEPCEKSHKRFRGTKNHKVVSGELIPENVDEPQVTSTILMLCSCARNEPEIYCTTHNVVVCSDCKAISHRHCETSIVDEMFTKAEDGSDDDTSRLASDIKTKITTLKNNRKQDLEKLTAETNNCKEDVSSFRKELNQHLDELEERALKDLDKCSGVHKEVVKQHLATCSIGLRKLSFDCTNHEKAKNSRDIRQRCITSHKLMQTCKSLDSVIKDMSREIHEPNISVQRSSFLSSILKKEYFCTLHHNLHGRSIVFNAEMQLVSSSEVNIRIESDKNTPWISGSTFLRSGEIVLCDRNNDCLKVFNLAFALIASFKLEGKPRDCCLVNDNEVLITLPEVQMVQRFQILPLVQMKQFLNFDKRCQGVAALDEDIFVTCQGLSGKEIRIIDRDGKLKSVINLNEHDAGYFSVHYISVSSSGMIYVSEVNIDSVSQVRYFTKDGVCLYKYSDPKDKGAVGMFVDGGQSLLVCYYVSNTVSVLSPDGTKQKDFLTSKDGINQPYSISFEIVMLLL